MMKRLFWLWLMVVPLLACQQAAPTPQPTRRGLGGGVMEEETGLEPVLRLSDESGVGGTSVLLSGDEFPENTLVEIRLSAAGDKLHEQQLLTLPTDEIGTFAAPLTMPILWPGTLDQESVELVVTAETLTDPALTVSASFDLLYDGAFRSYSNEVGGFTVEIPAAWAVSEAQNTPLGTMFLLGNEPLTPGDPAVSTILISEELTAARAAEQLLCGGGCLEEVRLQRVREDAALKMYKADIESAGSPTLTWYFVERDGRLIYWTLHDPVTYRSLDDLLETLMFEPVEVAAADDPTNTVTAAPTETVPPATPSTAPATAAITATETAAPTAAPTDTVTPADTATPTSTPTFTLTPSPTATATPTIDPFRNLEDAGPVETTTEFLLAVLRQQIVTVSDAAPILTEDFLEQRPSGESLLTSLAVDELFVAFNLARVQTAEVIVRIELLLPDDSQVERFVALELGEDEVWRIAEISGGPDEASTATIEPTAVGTGEGEPGEVTPTPENSPTVEP